MGESTLGESPRGTRKELDLGSVTSEAGESRPDRRSLGEEPSFDREGIEMRRGRCPCVGPSL